jgi:hypothetical protein
LGSIAKGYDVDVETLLSARTAARPEDVPLFSQATRENRPDERDGG